MENYYSTPQNNEKILALNELSHNFLRETTKWAKFLAIFGFIGIAFLLLFALFLGVFVSMLPSLIANDNPFFQSGGTLAISYIIVAIIYLFPVYYLYNFSVKTREAIDYGNPDLLAQGLRSLKSHYKFMGIMVIFCIAIYVVVLVSVVVLGLTTALTA